MVGIGVPPGVLSTHPGGCCVTYDGRMGFRDWVADAPVATFSGRDSNVILRKGRIELQRGLKKETVPLSEVTSVSLESGSELESRITATRLMAFGVFALAMKKKSGGERFLTIETSSTYWTVEVDRKKVSDAARFVGKIKAQMA